MRASLVLAASITCLIVGLTAGCGDQDYGTLITPETAAIGEMRFIQSALTLIPGIAELADPPPRLSLPDHPLGSDERDMETSEELFAALETPRPFASRYEYGETILDKSHLAGIYYKDVGSWPVYTVMLTDEGRKALVQALPKETDGLFALKINDEIIAFTAIEPDDDIQTIKFFGKHRH